LLYIRDKWFRLVAIFIPFLVVLYAHGVSGGLGKADWWRILLSLFFIVLICEASRFIIYSIRGWLKGNARIVITLLIGLAVIALLLMLSALLQNLVSTGSWTWDLLLNSSIMINDKLILVGLWGYGVLYALLIFPFLLVAYEVIYHYAQMRYSEKEKNRLEKEKLRAELQQLKSIINPHFLFNNLNSLSSLIAEDPEHAEVFLNEMTKVFRYMLRNNDTDLIPLSEEMNFMESYYHLLQTRYGKAIEMEVHIDSSSEDMLIPPLTLQLLVENAVKHNQLQKESPLFIILNSVHNKLYIRNSIRKREGIVESTGIGLQNINARYRMLNLPDAVIEKDDHFFTVTISLVHP